VGLSVFAVSYVSLRQARIDDEVRGRVVGASRFITTAFAPFAAVLGGAIGSLAGLRTTLAVGALGMLAGATLIPAARCAGGVGPLGSFGMTAFLRRRRRRPRTPGSDCWPGEILPGSPTVDPRGRVESPTGWSAMRLVLAEDSVLLREGLSRLLEEAGFEVVAVAGSTPRFSSRAASERPSNRLPNRARSPLT
jgi:hypothetical protein